MIQSVEILSFVETCGLLETVDHSTVFQRYTPKRPGNQRVKEGEERDI